MTRSTNKSLTLSLLLCLGHCWPLQSQEDNPFSQGGVVVDGVSRQVVVPGPGPNGVPTPGAPNAPGMPPKGGPGGPNPGGPPTPGAPNSPGATPSPDAPVKREDIKLGPPDKKEFDVRPDEQGMVQFQFRNQAWPDLLNWLANVSDMTLDWQELPNHHVNISTKRKFTVEEARDLFNRHLLLRGYTLLELDNVLQVVKTAGINVSLVPRVPPEALTGLPPNRFVRTSYSLTSLVASDVVNSFKPLISSNGTLTALESTNRLEAMDCAGNLAELYRLIEEEQSDEALERSVQEFKLVHVRAEIVKEQLSGFLGLTASKAPSRPMSPEEQAMQQQQQQMMMMQMQQQQQQQGGKAPKAPSQPKTEVHITANVRLNSLIVNAPPDKMSTIKSYIKLYDVPNEESGTLQRMETKMRIYRLASLDPRQLVNSMISMDSLEPSTKLEVDEKNRAVMAYASLADHLLIQETIKRLDGSAREVEVIQLRRLPAESVAGSIKFLFGQDKEKDDRSSRYMYDPWGYRRQNENKDNDAFRVAANSQDNQILIWANDIERKEVYKLLEELGEIQPKGVSRSNFRVIDATRSPDTKDYLKSLQEAWSKVSPVPLVLPDDSEFQREEDEKAKSPSNNKEESKPSLDNKPAVTNPDVTNREAQSDVLSGRLSAFQGPPDDLASDVSISEAEGSATVRNPNPRIDSKANERSNISEKKGAPVQIRFDEKGNLVLSGEDLDALDQLEQMMIANAPPQPGYEVIFIKNARPIWIELNLKDYFKEEEKDDKDSELFGWIFGFDSSSRNKKEDPQLGKKRKLRFLSDGDTSSIVVIGADEKQLKTIRSLIKLWDVPEKTTKQKLRYSKLVKIEYSRAEVIVTTIKEAYLDLLSTNDKAFSDKGKADKESKHDGSEEMISSGGAMNFNFKGKLSLGLYQTANSILVSAEGEDLLDHIISMIKELDMAAKPTGAVEMVQIGGTSGDAMEKALRALLNKKEPEPQPKNPNANGQPQNPEIDPVQLQKQQSVQKSSNKSRGRRDD